MSHTDRHQELDVLIIASRYYFNSRDQITREVIRSHYIDSAQPDITHVMVQLDSQPKVVGVYTCTVIVESRVNIASGIYDFDPRGNPGSSTVTVTG